MKLFIPHCDAFYVAFFNQKGSYVKPYGFGFVSRDLRLSTVVEVGITVYRVLYITAKGDVAGVMV